MKTFDEAAYLEELAQAAKIGLLKHNKTRLWASANRKDHFFLVAKKIANDAVMDCINDDLLNRRFVEKESIKFVDFVNKFMVENKLFNQHLRRWCDEAYDLLLIAPEKRTHLEPELLSALCAMLEAYAPKAKFTVDGANGYEGVLHPAVSGARKILREYVKAS